jgi:hypothetical protein
VFNYLWEEVSEARRLAKEAKRGTGRSTPANRGGVEEATELRMKSMVAQRVEEATELRMKSRVAQSSGVIRVAGRRVGVWILSWVKIDSEGGEEVKSLLPEEVRLVAYALGAVCGLRRCFNRQRFFF